MSEMTTDAVRREKGSVQDVQDKLPIEEQKWILDRISTYIRDIDSKNGIVLAALAIVAAVLFSNEWFCGFLAKAAYSGSVIQIVLLATTVVSFVCCLVSLFVSLMPRVHSPESDQSLIYSAGIAKFEDSEGYSAALGGENNDLRKDIVGQIHANAVIAEKKILWHARSLKALVVFLFLLFVFCLLESALW